MDDPWTPASWQTRPMTQRVLYPDPEPLRTVLAALARLPPLVTSWEVEALNCVCILEQMKDFARGVVDTRAIAFYVSAAAFFLFLACRVIESRRWR
ncbi:MAG: 3-deoxy-7-phosphoheptulonate synthase [Verrucomicrobiota bacterium]